ncbi:hypothetical protein BGZ46_010061 [Entomortierella lignicola]|nr:hypothetical protein BGZ46_010061 [Entomortierella lignicola]
MSVLQHITFKLCIVTLVILHTIALASSSPISSSSSATPYTSYSTPTTVNTPSTTTINSDNIQQPQKVANNSNLIAESNGYAWFKYFQADGTFISEDLSGGGVCYTIPQSTNWSILQVVPVVAKDPDEMDQLDLFSDSSCQNPDRDPGGQTESSLVLVASYFRFRLPQSIRWIRFSTSSPNATTTATLTSSHSGTAALPTTTATTTLVITTPAPSNFPTDLLPPFPTGNWGGPGWCHNATNSCGAAHGDDNDNHILIVAICVTILAVGFLLASAFYIYRTFYSPTDSNGNVTGSDEIFNSNHKSNHSSSFHSAAEAEINPSGFNSSYTYNHDEDENAPPRFMFDHRHDNINTNRNPKLFKESSSFSRTNNSTIHPSVHIPLQQRSRNGQASPSSELSLLALQRN